MDLAGGGDSPCSGLLAEELQVDNTPDKPWRRCIMTFHRQNVS